MFVLDGTLITDPWLYYQRKLGLFADAGDGAAGDGGAGDGGGSDGGQGDGGSDGRDGGQDGGNDGGAAAGGDKGGQQRQAQLGGGDDGGDKVPTLDQWHASIEDADDRKFAEQFDTPAKLANAARGLRQEVSKAVIPPGEDASEEDVAKYRKAIGVPETADAYEIALPDYAAKAAEEERNPIHESLKHFKSAAHEANLTSAQMERMSQAYFELEQSQIAAVVKADQEFADATEKQLRVEWPGEQFERNKGIANRFGETAVNEGALTENELATMRNLQTKDDRFVLDHPVFLKLFNFGMRGRTEDQPGTVFMDDTEREETAKTLEAKRQEIRDLTRQGKHKEAEALQEEVDKLDRQLHGDAPLVGTAGRTV